MDGSELGTPAVLHPDRLFHTGLVVEDLDAAMAGFTASLGLTWKGGWPATHKMVFDGVECEVELRIAFSLQGPPYVELIQAKEGTIWSPDVCGLHHLCYWSPEPLAAADLLQQHGYRRLSGLPESGGGYFLSPYGVRVEILVPEYYQRLLSWIERGPSAR